jgi:3-oxoacyl-[acyl-carrier protein] reductase
MTEPGVAELLDLRGQVALVTGGGRGIGRATAELLLEAGADVAIVSRGEAALAAAARELGAAHGEGRAVAMPADVADEAAVNAVLARVEARWGRLDILVNNAGLIHFGPIEAIAPASWGEVLGANLTGAYHCARAAAPMMRRQGRGRIVNIASVSGQTGGVSGGVDYAASKGGLIAFTKALARDLAPHGVTVNAIAPGQIDADPNLLTPEARARVTEMIPLGRLGTPREVAYAVLFLVSPMGAYITGATLDVNGGILKR